MVRPGWLTLWLGNKGERLAVRYLKKLGYRILARQSRSRIGEIDIVALDGDTIVFVEVKTRSSQSAGHPSEAITFAKQQQLTRVALAWLKSRGMLERRARFDVIAITWREGTEPVVEHYQSAFEAVGRGQMFS
ncbi:MAG: YraN family protein [Planctomycetaceae bacterium]|jgi:putative endonuclease|nr:YraN family protein [Planctomycetaceae bacterium]